MSDLEVAVIRCDRIEVAIPDPDPCEGFEPFVDHVYAIYNERTKWWCLCGDNTGSENLIVHPYQIDGLIKLLELMKQRSA